MGKNWLKEREECTVEKVKEEILKLGALLEETEAVGIFGSLLRPVKFNEYSDIDILVVLPDDAPVEEDARWYRIMYQALGKFRRDVTALCYTPKGLRKVPCWHTLDLAEDCVLVYDKGKVARILQRMSEEAHKAGLIRTVTPRGNIVWKMGRPVRFGEIIKVEVPDEDDE
jgi:predicted nucleotidyltransferase